MRGKAGRRRLRGAFIGFGNVAEKGHLPAWLREKRVSLQAVCDPSPERRKRARELLPDMRIYRSADELFQRESLDFVDVCTPPPSHAENILAALKRDLHVLCEKPFVGTSTDLERILRLCDRKGRIAFPVHNWKHAPVLAKARDWICKGLLGKVLYTEFHTLRTQPAIGLTPWRSDKENAGGGGIYLDHGWHGVYLLLNLHGDEPIAVSTWMHPSPAHSSEAERTAHLLLEFPSSVGSLFLTWNGPKRHNSARIYGGKGMAILEDNRITLHASQCRTHTDTFRNPLSHGSYHPDWFGPVAENFLSAMKHPEEARKELDEVRFCLEVARLGYASALKGGKRLTIPQRR